MIPDFINAVTHWLANHQWMVWLLAALSLFTVLATVVIVPRTIVRIPCDFFSHDRTPQRPWDNLNPWVRMAILIVKNLAGVLLILAGIVLSLPLVPGPGILTILAGLALVDLPGKHWFQRWLVSRRPVFDALNKLRRKHGQPPLEHP